MKKYDEKELKEVMKKISDTINACHNCGVNAVMETKGQIGQCSHEMIAIRQCKACKEIEITMV